MLGVGVIKGMLTTFSHLFRRPVTIQYPEEQMEMPPWTRGRPRLIYELDSGDLRCTACNACAIACPVDVIKIEQHAGPDRKKVLDRFDIDMGGCIECALCVEACPFRAIVMAPDFEMAYFDRADSLVYNMYELRIAGTPEVDAAMEHILGVKRGLAGQQARTGAAPAPPGARQPAAPAQKTAPVPAQPEAQPVPATSAPPVGALSIDPKELEGLSPRERALLYKERQREAGIGGPRRPPLEDHGEAPATRPPAPAPEQLAPPPARPATPQAAAPGEGTGYLGLDPSELEGLSPAERAARYKQRQREAGIGAPRKEE
jgi:NADH-quinone oxidoreductase subunit I